MKKIYSLSLSLIVAASTIPGAAQQLSNAGFEGTWGDCVPWTSKGNTTAQGTTPTGWNASNTIGTGKMGNMTLVETTAGYNSSNAALISNKEYNAVIVKKNIPGYLTLGTPWSTAEGTSAKNKDGGTFGGIQFAYRPDAMTFMYKSTGSADQPTVVAYTWKGTYSQASVPGNIVTSGSATKVTMTDRDRNILNMSTDQGGTVSSTSGAGLVGVINQRLNAEQADWTSCTLPFTYSGTGNPEKLNIIFAAGDYFTSDPKKNVSVTVDDVKFIYYSRLASLSVNGTPVEGFSSDTYSYTIDAAMPSADAFTYTTMGNSGSGVVDIILDKQTAVATITVSNSNPGGTDVDGTAAHTYNIQFSSATPDETPDIPADAKDYEGTLSVQIETLDVYDTMEDQHVYILNTGEGKCRFMLFNFRFGDIPVGDIILDDVMITTDLQGSGDYNGSAEHMLIGPDTDEDGNPVPDEDKLDTDVTLTGNINVRGYARILISVIWHFNGEDIPIDVSFSGSGPGFEIADASIEDIFTDANDAPVEYFNIQGMRVDASSLTPGIYIVRKGSETKKVYIK